MTDADAADWFDRARTHIETLPPKVRKPTKKAGGRPTS
ncbi:hypothetical protein N801_00540 [Knoellia aerolata DSM 18566]|uniref:Uncharacterized protein n=1 Tax=Knoellia aerolata DSM 18566 TaxID=1385519 RepID=A0A0A0JXT8_9MICO|nr:hypothetical protein N801_00540 [Knoellia aerolata DSM 18566]